VGVSWLRLDLRTATVAAVVLMLAAVTLRPLRRRWSDTVAAAAFEVALVSGLFALWQLANTVSHRHEGGGLANGRWVWHAERWLHVPNEVWFQRLVLGHHDVVYVANYYYATAHLTGMVVFLVWLWLRHRDRYSMWRNTLAFFTAMSLLVQIIPVAPPRLIGETGLVDTAMAYGQSVYTFVGSSFADQYAAMPSIHVGWAILIACAAWSCTRGVFRYIGLAHAVLTTFFVVVTANHYWFDGLAAVILLAFAWVAARLLAARMQEAGWRFRLPAPLADGTMAT